MKLNMYPFNNMNYGTDCFVNSRNIKFFITFLDCRLGYRKDTKIATPTDLDNYVCPSFSCNFINVSELIKDFTIELHIPRFFENRIGSNFC